MNAIARAIDALEGEAHYRAHEARCADEADDPAVGDEHEQRADHLLDVANALRALDNDATIGVSR